MIEKIAKMTKQTKIELFYLVAFILTLGFLYISMVTSG